MSLTISTVVTQEQVLPKKAFSTLSHSIPLYVYAVSFASLSAIIGVIWDISWHTTIGRDQFLSPPHLLIYAAAVFGGLFSGIQVLWNTFKASQETKKRLIKVWGFFYSSLGAMFCIWGAIAMLTSAPFDDWWHNAYGLDVVILSPPHTLLALGMLFLQFGACVGISKYLNLLESKDPLNEQHLKQQSIYKGLFIIAASSFLCMVCTLLTAYLDTRQQHLSLFYQVAATVVLLFLPAFKRALRLKWGMTAIALGYFFILGICNWVLQAFHAEPKLGPILNPVTHYQPLQFPILFFIPAIAMDLIIQKVKWNDWTKAFLLSTVFVLLLFAVQYPLSSFLLQSSDARNHFFGSYSWYYGAEPDWEFRYKFLPQEIEPIPNLLEGLITALVIGVFTSRISLRWGKWMKSIQR